VEALQPADQGDREGHVRGDGDVEGPTTKLPVATSAMMPVIAALAAMIRALLTLPKGLGHPEAVDDEQPDRDVEPENLSNCRSGSLLRGRSETSGTARLAPAG